MNFYLIGHDRINPILQLLICLYPDEDHTQCDANENPSGEYVVSTLKRASDGHLEAEAIGYWGDKVSLPCPQGMGESDAEISEYLRRALYLLLLKRLDKAPVWGMLTGVKPSKLVRNMLARGMTELDVRHALEHDYFVSEKRRDLCLNTGKISFDYYNNMGGRDIELYIGIPFCPAKCSYCSFVSNDVRKWGHMVDPYLETLLFEVKAMGTALKATNREIKSIYIGGGTPSILSETQLERLLTALDNHIDLSSNTEFTLEAGRPETITKDKLQIAKEHKIGRISINPQTMNDDVLRGVGRLHTAHDIIETYNMARQIGGFQINMDLIAGLPNDNDESLIDTVKQIISLDPENITLHSMARKKGAPLRFGKTGDLSPEVIDFCHELIYDARYKAYYLYRQKYIAGGLENVGFEKNDTPSRYNIVMMEELGHVAALGSGGVTKLIYKDGSLKRITNPKYPTEYIDNKVHIEKNIESLIMGLKKD